MEGIITLVSVLSFLVQNLDGQSTSFEESYEFSDVVFIGRVTYKNVNSNTYWFGNEGVHFNIEVVEYFKGGDLDINTWSYFSYPRSWDRSFNLGEEYLICANVEPTNYFLDLEGELMIIEKKNANKEILKARELSKNPHYDIILNEEEKLKILHKRKLTQTTIISFLLGGLLVGVLLIVTSRVKKTKHNN